MHLRLNSNLSKISAPTHPLLLQAVDAHPNLAGSSSVGSLNSLPLPLQHPMESFGKRTFILAPMRRSCVKVALNCHTLNLIDISTLTSESPTSPQWPILWPYGAAHFFEANSNLENAVQYAQPHQREAVVKHSQIGLQVMGLHPSTLTIDSGDFALPDEVTAQHLMRSGGPPSTTNAEPPRAELPGEAHTFVDMVDQPPRLTAADVPISVSSTLQLTLPSQSRSNVILSGCDHRTVQDQNQRHERTELHDASERAAQLIREADKEIERLREENVILRNQLQDNVRVRAPHGALPSLVSRIHLFLIPCLSSAK